MKRFSSIVFLFLIGMGVMAQNFEKLENYLDNKITGKLSPGVQFLVADLSGVLYEYNGGFANIEDTVAVSSQTQFKMYSSTKILTMIAIMQLVEQGLVNLDDSVSSYIPFSFPAEVTVRKTLSHTAGFGREAFIKEIHLASEDSSFNYSRFMAYALKKYHKIAYEPGTKNSYSNYGYLVLSAIVEEVSGVPYLEYVEQNIILKSGLTDQEYVGFEFSENSAVGYQKRRTVVHWAYSMMVDRDKFYASRTKDWQSYHPLYMKGLGFGGGFANAQGLAKVMTALLKNDLMSEATLKETMIPQYYKDDKLAKQTLGWWTGDVSGHKSFSHAGGGGGYSCELRIYPEQGLIRLMYMNKTQSFSDLKLFREIDELWMN